MKTALEILNETVVNGFKSDRRHELTIIAMQSYALQVAEAVRDECITRINNADMLCGDAINRRLKDKTSCGKWCGGCDQPVVDSDVIITIDLTTFIK